MAGRCPLLVFLAHMLYNTDVGKAFVKEEISALGILSDFMNDPVGTLIVLCYQLPAVFIALTLHEVAHGYVALKCGDPTAQMLGRLSLNPVKHLDPIGTVCMFLFGIGYARPVPVNPRNYRNFRRDDILVSVAGIAVNLCLFLLSSVLIALVQLFLFDPSLFEQTPLTHLHFTSFRSIYTNILLQDHHLTYFAELGLTEYLRSPALLYVQRFLMYFSLMNLGLAVFNLLPIPPLDGYHLFNDILFRGKLHIPYKVMQGISVVFILLLLFTDYISNGLYAVRSFLQDSVMQGIFWIFGVL